MSYRSALDLCTTTSLSLPVWLVEEMKQGKIPEQITQLEEQMNLAIRLSQRNVEENAGGPFGALVVETLTGRIVSLGVNIVAPSHCSLAHAESVAVAMAQAHLKSFTLGADHLPAHTLVTSSQPCSMCFGVTLWSGVRKVVFGATREDVEELTAFDEGPIPENWRAELKLRGIETVEDICREEAKAVLKRYSELGGIVYNGLAKS